MELQWEVVTIPSGISPTLSIPFTQLELDSLQICPSTDLVRQICSESSRFLSDSSSSRVNGIEIVGAYVTTSLRHYVTIRHYTSLYVTIRHYTSLYVTIRHAVATLVTHLSRSGCRRRLRRAATRRRRPERSSLQRRSQPTPRSADRWRR
jgi:hypothetical protein